jgi:allophanate hydrolase
MDLTTLPFTLPHLREAYAKGVTPAEIIAEVHARIRQVDDPAIFIHLIDEADVLEDALSLGEPGPDKPLWGIPFVIKDNIDAAGLPTTAACPAFSYVAEADSHVVGLLRKAGAILIGKTNLDQFATGLVGVRSPHGVPRNAIDPSLVPGGSSSGSAVAVAQGIACFSLGTDTAGSGRSPAALNNIVGLKPTLGTLSSTGLVPACRTLDTISIFALTVDDAWEVFETASGYDPADGYSRDIAITPTGPVAPGLRIGIPDADSIEFFGDDLQAQAFDAAIAELENAGAVITPMDFTLFYDVARMLYDGVWVAERHSVIEEMMNNRPDDILPVIRDVVGKAIGMTATDCFRSFYKLQDLRREAASRLAAVDLLCVPTLPTYYRLEDLEADPIGPNSRLGTYTNFVNLLDLCGIAVPTAPRLDGLPGSVTFLATSGKDGLATSAARLMQDPERKMGATDFLPPAPAEALAFPGNDEIALAVCGAHMTGLPLNYQLTDLGGRFLRTAQTADSYSFHALAGGPPERPGLIRKAPGTGAAIDIEIWNLPASALGTFISRIPAPLAIGTIDLADGTEVKGFVCEESGVEGGTDITAFGGWRAWLASGTGNQRKAG